MNHHQQDVMGLLDKIMQQYKDLDIFFKVCLVELVMAQLVKRLIDNHVIINPNDGVITWRDGSKSYPTVHEMQQVNPTPPKGRGRDRPPKVQAAGVKGKGRGKSKFAPPSPQQPPSAI